MSASLPAFVANEKRAFFEDDGSDSLGHICRRGVLKAERRLADTRLSALFAAKEEDHMKEKLSLIILGAIFGAGPTVFNSWLQAKWGRDQRATERKLTSIRGYSTACHQSLMLMWRAADVIELNAERWNSDSRNNSTEVLDRQIESLSREMEEAYVGWRVEVDVANALFGTQIETREPVTIDLAVPSGGPLTAELKKQWQKSLAEVKSQSSRYSHECSANTRLLVRRLGE